MQIIARINSAELNVVRWLSATDRFLVNRIMVGLSRLGDGWFWAGLGVGVVSMHETRWLNLLVAGVTANVLATAVFLLVKRLAGRPRPCELNSDLKPLMGIPDHYSFPSGHAINAFAFATVFRPFVPEGLAQILLVLACGIAFSRVYLRLHYPSDVLAGSILGYGIGIVSLLLI